MAQQTIPPVIHTSIRYMSSIRLIRCIKEEPQIISPAQSGTTAARRLVMEGWSSKPKAAGNDEDDQPSMQASTEASSQNLVTTETPGPFDVLLGRGQQHTGHPGNERLQTLLNLSSVWYNATSSRHEKTLITQEIVQSIQTAGDLPVPGRFLKFDKSANGWVEVDDAAARIKVSHAIRYASRYRKRKATPPANFDGPPSPQEAIVNTTGSDASRRPEVHQQERPRDRSPLIFDESIILAGLGHDIHHSSNDTNDDDDASVLYDRGHPSKEDSVS
jgi:hypothetical protein